MSRVDAALATEWSGVMLGNYGVPRIELAYGRGAEIWDRHGNRYLDLIGGIAVSSLGHGDARIATAVADQVSKLAHSSNLYAHRPGLDLARRLLDLAKSDGRVLFTQDGATANEAALKLARRYGRIQQPNGNRQRVIATEGGFHGRTMGALAVTGNPAKRDHFGPFGIDVEFVPYGDASALQRALDPTVVAVIVEPVQGENGVVVPPTGYLQQVRHLTSSAGALFIADEVQSGIGRCGSWFATHAAGVRPDVITLAKGLAGGLPLGALIVEPNLIDVLQPGDHGTTFGGNPVACRAALAVIEAIDKDGLLERSLKLGARLQDRLRSANLAQVRQVRGSGLWIAIELVTDVASIVELAALEAGFLVNAVKPNVIRLAPPLVIAESQLDEFAVALPGLLRAAENV